MKAFRRLLSSLLVLVSALGIIHGVVTLSCNYIFSIERTDKTPSYISSSSRKVLYISSYNNSYDSVDRQLRGLRTVFDQTGIAFDVQYMDMLNFNSKVNLELFYESLLLKLTKRNTYAAVILGDDFALSFASSHRDELFDDIPMIFMGVNDPNTAEEAVKNKKTKGWIQETHLQETLEIAMKFNPESRMIYAIYDDSSEGIERQSEFFALKSKYPGFLFRGIDASEYSREAFGRILSVINPSNIVIYLGVSEDKNGKWYSLTESTEFISANAGVPVYSDNIATIGKGFVGGSVIDYEEMARIAAQSVKKLIEEPSSFDALPSINVYRARYLFDNDIMKKYEMNGRILTEDTAYLNKAMEYWNRYQMIFAPFIEIFVFLVILMILLLNYLVIVRKSRQQISFSAKHDGLTNLYNRYAISEKIEENIKNKNKFAVLLVDIDDFRSINDFNTHKCGDAVLVEIASRLKTLSLESNYEVSRYGGDNFLLIYKGANLQQNDPEIYYIRQLLGNAIDYNGKTLFIHVSIGIVNSSEAFTTEDYLANVDMAMHAAKENGHNKYVFFSDEMKKNILQNAEIGRVLEEACKNNDFNVVYQPQIDASTGLIYGYEALVRLSDNSVPPGFFIPIAERDGHIAKIGRIVTEKVLKQMAAWREEGLELHRVSINYSAGQMGDKGYIPYLRKLMRTYNIPADLIGIEITESLFMGNKTEAQELFKQFDELGIKIALDDFGTGYSSLNYLTYLPIQVVKLDKSTVDTYLDGQAAFIENLVNLVHSLGMKLTVEGVEERWQYDKLKSFNCDYIQGYFFSKPLSGDEILKFSPEQIN